MQDEPGPRGGTLSTRRAITFSANGISICPRAVLAVKRSFTAPNAGAPLAAAGGLATKTTLRREKAAWIKVLPIHSLGCSWEPVFITIGGP
jgi:hypothetical protein